MFYSETLKNQTKPYMGLKKENILRLWIKRIY